MTILIPYPTFDIMNFVINLLASSLAVFVTSYLLPGVELANFLTAIVVAIVLGLVNALIRPLILLLTLPINILTLGLFTLVINASLVLLVAAVVPGFTIRAFSSAILFAIILWLINWFLSLLIY